MAFLDMYDMPAVYQNVDDSSTLLATINLL